MAKKKTLVKYISEAVFCEVMFFFGEKNEGEGQKIFTQITL